MPKSVKIVFIVIVCLLLILPGLTLNLNAKYSNKENRPFSSFPELYQKDGKLNKDFLYGLGDWFEDRLGFRDEMLGIYSKIMVKGFGLSSSEKVIFGSDGWMFYTGDKNVQVGTGQYLLTNDQLKLIASNQQAISDYYKSVGKEYFLIFTPSKASVYTEHISGFDSVTYTLMDQVTDYLKEHTDVKVINPKQALIDAKDKGDLYLKTDTHWNQLGSYTAYVEMLRQMKEYGIDLGDPVSVSFEDTTIKGEFSNMLGDSNLLSPEASVKAVWDKRAEMTTSGNPLIDAVAKISSSTTYMSANTYAPEYYNNPNSESDKKCLIYVDSMWAAGRGLPWYFSENFSDLVYTRIRNADQRIDQVFDSDVVIYSCVERFIPTLAGMPANIPIAANESYETDISEMTYADFPKFDTWTGRKGFCVDGETTEGISIKGATLNGLCVFKGWGVDFLQNSAATDVYVRVGGKTYKAIYGIERNGVVNTFGHEKMRYSGFEIRIPSEELTVGETMQFIMVNRNTGTTYTPAEYILVQ